MNDMIIGNREFKDEDRTYIMGILNVTPDSFFDGGKYDSVSNALIHTEQMIEDGADIIDVGGESSRPGFDMVGDEEELKRIIPVITAIKKRFDIPVSVDTFHWKVAREAAACGADMINDIWGLKYGGSHMAEVVKETGTSVCIMHNSGCTVKAGGGSLRELSDGFSTIIDDLRESIDIAKKNGISDDRIMVDPGIGFAKDYNMNMAAIANADRLKELGYPVLLGTSNKSVIGITLDLPVEERLSGTLATSVFAAIYGCSFLRVHDVKNNKRAVCMAKELLACRMK